MSAFINASKSASVSVSTSTSTKKVTKMINTKEQFANVLRASGKFLESDIIEALAKIVAAGKAVKPTTKDVFVVTKGATVTNPKTKKGKVTRREIKKVSEREVVNTAAVVAAERQEMAKFLIANGLEAKVNRVKGPKVINQAEVRLSRAKKLNEAKVNAKSLEDLGAKTIAFVAAVKQVSALTAELAHLDRQVIKIKSFKPARTGAVQPMVKITKTGTPSAGALRNKARAARGIAQATANCARPLSCPLPYTRNEAKVSVVTREESRALLIRSKAVNASFASSAVSTFSLIRDLHGTAVVAEFTARAAAFLTQSKQSLPAIAGQMTMNLDIKLLVHNAVMDAADHAPATAEEYQDAVLKQYTSICAENNIEVSDEIEMEILELADTGFVPVESQPSKEVDNGGDDNLDKNVTKTESTIKESPMMNKDFNQVFESFFGLVSNEGTHSIAEILFHGAANIRPLAPKWANNAKKVAKHQAKIDAVAARIAKWEEVLGYINDNCVFAVGPKSKLENCNSTAIRNFLAKLNLVTNQEKTKVKVAGKTLELGNGSQLKDSLTGEELFFATVAESISNLGAGDQAQLIVDLFVDSSDADVELLHSGNAKEEPSLRIRHAVFNFENGTLEKNGFVLNVNRGTMFRKASTDVFGSNALFMFAFSLANASKKSINTQIGHASNLFKRQENYGAEASSDDIRFHVNNNLILSCRIEKTARAFPFFQIKSAKQHPSDLGHILSKGIFAACDKTNVSWITIENGAAAMGLGYKDGIVLNSNDNSKPNKVYNRPASNKYLFAAQVDANGVDLRERSNFCFVLPDGQRAFIKGRRLRAVFTNSRLTLGSGIAITNPELYFPHQVRTNVSEPLNLMTLPAEWRNQFASMDAFAKHVRAEILDAIDETAARNKAIKPREAIATLKLGDSEETRVVLTNNKDAVDVKIVRPSVEVDDFNENVLNINVKVEIAGNDQFLKLRTPFYKATTHPMDVRIGAVAPSDWDILLNIECVKGQNLLAVMWANAHGLLEVNPHTGTAQHNGRTIDLTKFDTEIAEWRRQQVAKNGKTTLVHHMARSTFEEIEANFANCDDIKVLRKTETQVVVEEQVEWIAGDAHFDIEIATARECVGSSNLTFEAANGILLQRKALGESILTDLNGRVSNLKSLVNSYGASDKAPKSFNVETKEGREAFSDFAFGAVKGGFTRYISNHRAVIKCLDKALSAENLLEIELKTEKSRVVISPKALLAFGQFSRNGSSAREVAKVVDFLFYINNVSYGTGGTQADINKQVGDVARVVEQWAKNLSTSAKALKKVTRAGEVICGKVRTSWLPELHSFDGIPVLGLNPLCPMVRMLKVNDGDLVGINRTPMPFLTVCRVRFVSKVDVAHALISPFWWHLANEGDSDGDGIGIMNLRKHGFAAVTTNADGVITTDWSEANTRAKAINNALMGPGGYLWMYANTTIEEYLATPAADRPELPFDEFLSYKDKHGKKALSFNEENSVPVIATSIKGEVFDLDAYSGYAELVAKHYKAAVGNSYGMCSQLVFASAEFAYREGKEKQLELFTKACVVAWRRIYEGLGLAGWTPEADSFFAHLIPASKDWRRGEVKVHNGRMFSRGYRLGEVKDAMPNLKAGLVNKGMNSDVCTNTLISTLLRSFAICLVYRAVESADSKPVKSLNDLENAAIVAGVLRRIGQGKDPVVVEANEDGVQTEIDPEEAALTAKSLTEEFLNRNLTGVLNNPFLNVVAKNASEAHSTIRNRVRIALTNGQ